MESSLLESTVYRLFALTELFEVVPALAGFHAKDGLDMMGHDDGREILSMFFVMWIERVFCGGMKGSRDGLIIWVWIWLGVFSYVVGRVRCTTIVCTVRG